MSLSGLSPTGWQSSPRMPALRTSSQHWPPPNTVPLSTLLSRTVSRIRPWQLDAFRKRSTPAQCHHGVRPSGVNASRWLSENVRPSPSNRLCYALAFGVYMSSYLKDLVCSLDPTIRQSCDLVTRWAGAVDLTVIVNYIKTME
ncbi:hypothetical protein EDB89DRAFT_2247185 [Lactarius sanguifluus]|nr:hypothetical protein EDB89DRAFT_2247185 [Lactarius sanguifluus]